MSDTRRKKKIKKLREKQWNNLHKSGEERKFPPRTTIESDKIDVGDDECKDSHTEEEWSGGVVHQTKKVAVTMRCSPRKRGSTYRSRLRNILKG